MTPDDMDKAGGADSIESMIDQAIDDLFVPRASDHPGQTAAQPKEEPEPAAQEESFSDGLDMEISWEQTPPAEEAAQTPQAAEAYVAPEPSVAPEEEPVIELAEEETVVEEELFTQPPPREPSFAEEFAMDSDTMELEDDDETDAPKLPILRPLYERLLSIDWEINQTNIAAFEDALSELSAQCADNMHAQTGIKMAAVCCKYLRASKTLASPLALSFLRSSVQALDIFLQPPSIHLPAKDGLVNDLMGLYNDMKADANRLRAVALRQRQASQEAAKPSPEPTPEAPLAAAPVEEAVTAAPSGDMREQLAQVRATLETLIQTVTELEKKFD